jgi:hypothetical protein
MSKILLSALTAAVLSSALLGLRAAAMPLAAPALGIVNARAAFLQRVTNVCGMNGCAPVHVLRVRRPPPGFVTRAAPLVFPATNPPQSAPENK